MLPPTMLRTVPALIPCIFFTLPQWARRESTLGPVLINKRPALTTELRAVSGAESGRRDSNPRSRAPTTTAAQRCPAGCRCPTSRQSVRTGGFEPPISWSPTRRDARLRYVLPTQTKKARCLCDTGLSVFSRNRYGLMSRAQWIEREHIRRLLGDDTRPTSLFATQPY